MSQADGYVRIVTQNDTTDAQRSTEQLGDTIRDSMDTTPVDNMNNSVGGLQDGISDTGEAALKTGDLIKANLISAVVTQGIQELGDVLKNAASQTIEIADGMDRAVNKITAATNASAEDIEKLRTVIETIYADNFGENAEDIADSIAKIKQNLGELSDEELINVTESAYALQDVFDYSVEESSRAVKAMMKNFNISADEAYDYIARGAQNGLDYSGELLDNISEYSVQFKKMGLSASDMFTIFENGAESGAWNLDKIGDSVKELAIRVIDGSNTSKEGFEALGFNADSMAEKFAAGGESARAAFQEVISTLAGMDDPVAQNIAGVNLLGTMWEDMGADAVLALGNISDSAYDCAGAMDSIKDVNYNDLSNSLDSVKRQIDLLIQPIGESLIPILDEAADTIAEVAEKGDLKEIATSVAGFVSGSLTLLLKNLDLILSTVTGITAAVIAFKIANVLTGVISSWQNAALQVKLLGSAQEYAAVKTAAANGTLSLQEVIYSVLSGKISLATAKQYALNTAMSLNPAGAIAAVIGLLATALTGFAISAGNASSAASELNDSVNQMNSNIENSISENEAEMSVLKDKAKRYEELRSSINLTSEEQAELKSLAQELQEVLGDEVTVVNQLTGEYNDLTAAVDNYISKKSASVKLSAYEDAAKEAYIIKAKAEKKIAEIESKYGSISSWDSIDGIIAASKMLGDNGYMNGYQIAKDAEAALKAIEEADATIAEWQRLETEAFTSDSKPDSGTYEWGVSIAEGEKQKALAAQAAWEEKRAQILAQREEEKSANEALYKQYRADAKYSYDMGVIDANEYYSQLAVLRDKYLYQDSEEWRSVNVEIKKYYDSLSNEQKKAYEQQLAAQEKAAEEAAKARVNAYNEEKSQLEFRLRTNKISEKKYYEELAKIRDKYLDKNSDEWRSSYLETYEYNQKILQANKDALNQLINDTSDSTLSALQNIISARDSLAAKLVDFNKTFEKITETVPETVAVKGNFTITTAEHEVETYKMGADSIEDNIRVLEQYGEMLDALKARGADENTLNDILAMDIEEGMDFGSKLLKMSNNEWNSYFSSMEKLRQTAADISAKYYQSEVDNLKENFVDKLRNELDGLGSDMYKIGADVAKEFVSGWNEALGTKDLTLGDLMKAVSGGTLDTAPRAAQQLTSKEAAAASTSAVSTALSAVSLPIYIGSYKLTDLFIDATNGKIIKDGKNVLLT